VAIIPVRPGRVCVTKRWTGWLTIANLYL
jgi:hypothetical protein